MKNENIIYLKGIDILECDLTEEVINVILKIDKMKDLFQLLQNFTCCFNIHLFIPSFLSSFKVYRTYL